MAVASISVVRTDTGHLDSLLERLSVLSGLSGPYGLADNAGQCPPLSRNVRLSVIMVVLDRDREKHLVSRMNAVDAGNTSNVIGICTRRCDGHCRTGLGPMLGPIDQRKAITCDLSVSYFTSPPVSSCGCGETCTSAPVSLLLNRPGRHAGWGEFRASNHIPPLPTFSRRAAEIPATGRYCTDS